MMKQNTPAQQRALELELLGSVDITHATNEVIQMAKHQAKVIIEEIQAREGWKKVDKKKTKKQQRVGEMEIPQLGQKDGGKQAKMGDLKQNKITKKDKEHLWGTQKIVRKGKMNESCSKP